MWLLWTNEIMRLLILISLNLHIAKVFSKKYASSSEESIENLIYYRDCKHKTVATTLPPAQLRLGNEQKQPDCPFPKMCCSMSCGNDCDGPQSMLGRHMSPMQKMESILPISNPPRQPMIPVQPQLQPRGRKKKNKQLPLIPPLGGRRDAGLTKNRIKSLIAQDTDIRKILKDLVRVTMQKVNLLELISARRNAMVQKPEPAAYSEEDD